MRFLMTTVIWWYGWFVRNYQLDNNCLKMVTRILIFSFLFFEWSVFVFSGIARGGGGEGVTPPPPTFYQILWFLSKWLKHCRNSIRLDSPHTHTQTHFLSRRDSTISDTQSFSKRYSINWCVYWQKKCIKMKKWRFRKKTNDFPAHGNKGHCFSENFSLTKLPSAY